MSVLDQVEAILDRPPITPGLEMRLRNPVPAATSIPEELQDWADANGLSVSWQTYTTEHMSRMHARGIRPVQYEVDVDEETREAIPAQLLFTNPEGLIQSGNAVLCVQDSELRAKYRGYIAEKTKQQAGAGDMAALQESTARQGVSLGTPDWAETSKPSNLMGGLR